MPHRTRPMTALLVFTGLNAILVSTITPVYDFVCFLPFWERRGLGFKGSRIRQKTQNLNHPKAQCKISTCSKS
ncbi:hypothetical protein ABKV19_026264 [Rosa sericea]